MQQVQLKFDTSACSTQVNELIQLLKARFPQGIPDALIGYLDSLPFDVVLCDGGATMLADGTDEVIVRLDFGSRFEQFRTALRTGEFRFHGGSDSMPPAEVPQPSKHGR